MSEAIAWVEGRIGPAAEARIPILDHGFLFGDGVFEGIRVTERGIFRLDDHMKRLATAGLATGIGPPEVFERAREVACETTRAWGRREGYLRLIVTRGEDGSLLRKGGVDCGLVVENERTEIAPVEAAQAIDPTGCGDAYRAGLLYGIANGLPLATGTRLGSLMGSLKVARSGPQGIELDFEGVRAEYRKVFGEDF